MNRLTLRLALAIAALVTGMLAVGLYVLSEHHFNSMVEGQRHAAELQNRILEAALRHQMLDKHAKSELIATILHEVGSQPEVQGVMILDHDGVVRQASHPGQVGQQVARDSAACMVCHQKAPIERNRWAVLDLPGGEVLRSVQPIENRPECYACHPPEKHLNGILILDVSLAGLQAQLGRDRTWMIAATTLLGLLLLASVGLIMRRLILGRLATLGETARSIAAGDLTRRVEVRGDDTITSLAMDFNDMANSVLGLVTEVQEREAQLANVMNSVDDGLVVLDQDFRIVAANHAFCRRFGSHPEALHGHRCQEALNTTRYCEVNDAGCPSVRCLATGEVHRATFQLPSRNGEPGRVEEVHASPVFDQDGNVSQVVEIWRDITDRVLEETRLAELERLESLGALASGFSHEVNTPLATTLTCAEAILGRIDGAGRPGGPPASWQEIRDIAETIRGQVLRCRKITEQFRRFSRGIPPSTEPVDLMVVVTSIVAIVTPTAREAAVTIRIDDDGERLPLVTANTEAVQHVVLNLLVNAIQSFENGGGTVTVSCHAGADVRLRIRDQGRGIPPEARRHLFEPFRTSRLQGTGVGLFHSRGIMRRFGGDVRLAESEVGVGSCFEVVFARARDEAA
ncbi:MAG: PAS domain-containing protein [Deltaproteobacteria bacterium]|nr:PAS domain-containing protein [Deltaproteobacteria bacterium]